jgi:hypothetical protein
LRGSRADRVRGAELGGYVDGLLHGVGKGVEAFKTAVRTGEASDAAAKVDNFRRRAIPGRVGTVIRTPTRFLTAEDEFFKAVTRQGAVGRLAARKAASEGLLGDDLARRVAQLRANPTPDIEAQARDFARYMTFQRDPSFLGQKLQEITDRYPGLKFLIPFIRTQENLVKFAAERSPVAFIMPSVRAELRAGGARRDVALAKVVIGSAVGYAAYEAAAKGVITGGEPMDNAGRNNLHDSGWQPYSIKVGDTYISYRRLDPLSLGVSVAADLATYDKYMTPKEREQGALAVAQLVGHNIAGSFWMESVGNVYDLATNPAKEAPNQAANIVGALLVPALIAQPTASMDPYERRQTPEKDLGWAQRAAQTIINRVKGRIPGLRQTLPPKEDAFGQPVRNYGRLGPDFLSPFPIRVANPDPTAQALVDNGLRVGTVGNTAGGEPLTAQQRRSLATLSAQYIKSDLADALRDPAWARAAPGERQRWFEDIKRKARDDARADLGLGGDGDGAASGLPAGFRVDVPPGFTIDPPKEPARPPQLAH